MYFYIIFGRLGIKKIVDVTRVNDAASMLRFHSSKYVSEVASYRMYRSNDKGSYKVFLEIVDKWAKRLGLDGYFYLLNFSPFAAPAITNNIHDLCNVQARYRGAFAPAGPPPDGDQWIVVNFAVASKFAVNNYGVHRYNFSVVPVSFIWDWLHVRNTINIAVCITINGVFLCCFRGLKSSLQVLDVSKEIFSCPVTMATANISWKATMKP
jgi:hypothetical protein